jgi:hypothetical protein
MLTNKTYTGKVNTASVVSIEKRGDIKPTAPLTDEEFMHHFHAGTLPGWGHDSVLRLVYLLLQVKGRSSNSANEILDILAGVEGDNTHVTLNYFWLQMVTYYMAVVAKHFGSRTDSSSGSENDRKHSLTFNEFMSQPRCQPLRNQLLYQKYYSRSVIDRSAEEFALPDLKQFPTLIE